MDVVNFFREDLSEVLGVCYDEEKIFLARKTDKVETAEINFEIDLNDKNSATEQLAEKIKLECNKRGWKVSKVGLILREGTASTFQTDFKNVPANEIENAVKIWAIAHVGKAARYTSINFGEEIWMEALPASIVEEYISAFEKNSMQLCALTEIPPNAEEITTSIDRAIFAVDIVKNKKSPNILTQKISTWNIKKISLTAAAIFFALMIIFSAKLSYDYFTASTRAETAQNRFNSQNEIILKQELDASTAQIKRFNGLISSQNINSQKLNALIKIGQIPGADIFLDKIKTTGETFELEGVAESPDAVKIYLSRLKNSVSPKVKLKSSNENDGQIIFSISVIF